MVMVPKVTKILGIPRMWLNTAFRVHSSMAIAMVATITITTGSCASVIIFADSTPVMLIR